jgi:hypothetical protein
MGIACAYLRGLFMKLPRPVRLVSAVRRSGPRIILWGAAVGTILAAVRSWPHLLVFHRSALARWPALTRDQKFITVAIIVAIIVGILTCIVPIVLWCIDQRRKHRDNKREFLHYFDQVPLGGFRVAVHERLVELAAARSYMRARSANSLPR